MSHKHVITTNRKKTRTTKLSVTISFACIQTLGPQSDEHIVKFGGSTHKLFYPLTK